MLGLSKKDPAGTTTTPIATASSNSQSQLSAATATTNDSMQTNNNKQPMAKQTGSLASVASLILNTFTGASSKLATNNSANSTASASANKLNVVSTSVAPPSAA